MFLCGVLDSSCNPFSVIFPESVQLDDLKDSISSKNRWLIRTPRKSFFVAASCQEEKQAWIEHMTDCQSKLLMSGRHTLGSNFAVTWIPDEASPTCMRCSLKFTVAHRRHHCRNCGYLVCGACSKNRVMIEHIHPTKPLRICMQCHRELVDQELVAPEIIRQRGDSEGRLSSDEEGMEVYSMEEEMEENLEDQDPDMSSWSPYVYLNPQNFRP